MTKAQLIEKVIENTGGTMTRKEAGDFVQATMDALAEGIRGGRLSYPGFGTFQVKERAARSGRNPKTGEPIQIAASKSVSFKPAPKFKESL